MTLEKRVSKLTERMARAEIEQTKDKSMEGERMFNRRRKRRLSAAAIVVFLAAGTVYLGIAAAEPIPSSFSYEGMLERDGVPVDDQEIDMIFKWFENETTATPLNTTGQRETVSVSNGRFSAELYMPAEAANSNGGLYLGITVVDGGEEHELGGRQQVLSAPYALQASTARTADTLGTLRSSDFQRTINKGCGDGEYVYHIAADGSVRCRADQNTHDGNTEYSANRGLVLEGTQFSVNTPIHTGEVKSSDSNGNELPLGQHHFCALSMVSASKPGNSGNGTWRGCNVYHDGSQWVLKARAAGGGNEINCRAVCF